MLPLMPVAQLKKMAIILVNTLLRSDMIHLFYELFPVEFPKLCHADILSDPALYCM